MTSLPVRCISVEIDTAADPLRRLAKGHTYAIQLVHTLMERRRTDEPVFGFPNEDRRNRLYLKVGESKWSKPLSFEPVAADMQIVLGSNSGKSDTYVGLSYSEGLGKYKLTKVITIAPRFMVKNMFTYALRIRQHSTNKDIVVKKGDTVPIHELQSGAPAQLSMAFDEPNLKW